MSDLKTKEINLKEIISKYNSAVIAFSGGVDSTLLAKVVSDVLNDKIYLVTVSFSAVSEDEFKDAGEISEFLNIRHEIIKIDELEIPFFSENNPDRCYHCKKYIFSKIKEFTDKINAEIIFDGSNADDTADFRPGRKALKELGIISPLQEAGFTKSNIRKLSELYNLPTKSKPSYACLASRIPYGEKIDSLKLQRIEIAEKKIRKLGFTQFRVRNHENLARLEFISGEIEKAWKLRKEIENICLNSGFKYVCIDCDGYKTGSLNRELTKDLNPENAIAQYAVAARQ